MIKFLLILIIFTIIVTPNVNAIPLSDKTGFKFTFPIKTDDHSFIVEATGNLQVTNLDFDKEKKSITLFTQSSLDDNYLEVIFPNDLIGGDYTIFLDDDEFVPKVKEGKHSTLVSMNFADAGQHKIEIFGTTYLDTFNIKDVIDLDVSDGYVKEIDDNQSTNSLIFTLFDPGDDGNLSIKLSDDIITPFDDGSFIVLVDDVQSEYVISDNVLSISFNSSNEKIEIIGTYVIPEFHEIAPLVLTTSFIGLIALKKYKKLFI